MLVALSAKLFLVTTYLPAKIYIITFRRIKLQMNYIEYHL